MDNVIQINGFQFQNYQLGRKRILKALERISAGETERVPFILRQVGEFFRLARIRSGLSIEAAALHLGLEARDLSAIENGSGGAPCTLIARLCSRYGVERDFEEFFSYLRGATRPEEMAAFQKARPILEQLGWIRPKDW